MLLNKSFLKYLNIYLSILRSKLFNKRIPVIANILIVNRCNLKCFYCYPNSFNRQIEDMSFGDFKKIIDILNKKGTKIVIFLGGEPLIQSDFSQFVDYVLSKGMFCEVVTNGYFVKERLDTLKRVDSVCVSIDGNEESNDKNRGQGSFKRAMEAIEILLENKIHTRIKAVITRNNVNDIDFLANLAKEKGMVLMAILPTVYEDRIYPNNVKDLWLSKDEYRNFIKKLIQLKKEGYPIFDSFTALRYCLRWPFEFHEILYGNKLNNIDKIISCTAPSYQVFIDTDTTFLMPCMKKIDIKNKSILDTDFDKWWIPQESFGCKTCAILPNLDKSLIYNMNLEAIINIVRIATFKKKQA